MIHPAYKMPFGRLISGLRQAVADGLVSEKRDGDLSLFTYTRETVYDARWDAITTVARGLIIDNVNQRIKACPFPKFFNLGEGDRQAPCENFEAFEKLDGSLIIAFHYAGQWRTATKGSFDSDQAKLAAILLPEIILTGYTFLFELVGPSNKIVVWYPKDELRLLGMYGPDGEEICWKAVSWYANKFEIPLAKKYDAHTLADLTKMVETLPANEEGFVLRFEDGTRLKLKGLEYRRLHALISRLSPLTVWESMLNGDDELMRRELPEEFWSDFDSIRTLLNIKLAQINHAVLTEVKKWAGATDKEVGLALSSIPEPGRSFVFSYRKGTLDSPKSRKALYNMIRPTGNHLPGYRASFALNAVLDESA